MKQPGLSLLYLTATNQTYSSIQIVQILAGNGRAEWFLQDTSLSI